MKLSSVIIATCLLFMGTGVTNAATSSDLTPASAVAEHFLVQLKQGNVLEAFHSAFKSTEPALGTQSIDNIAAQTSAILKTFGTISGWSVYQTDRISPNFIRQTYLVRCEFIPLFITIQIYNSGKSWNIIDTQLNSYTNGRNANFYGETQEEK